MKFAADEHIPFPTIKLLRDSGHDVVSIREEFLGIDDEAILSIANAAGQVVLTCDSDFGPLIFQKKVDFTAGLVFFRLGHFEPDEIAHLVLRYVDEYGAEFQGRLTVISRNKFRQRDL